MFLSVKIAKCSIFFNFVLLITKYNVMKYSVICKLCVICLLFMSRIVRNVINKKSEFLYLFKVFT